MAAADGPRIAALAFDGWDTHENEGGAKGRLFNLLTGLDLHFGITDRIEIGGAATARFNLSDHTTNYAIGPQIAFVPAQDVVLTIGYNVSGFKDRDFAAARNTNDGVFAAMRVKLDRDTFGFLGL